MLVWSIFCLYNKEKYVIIMSSLNIVWSCLNMSVYISQAVISIISLRRMNMQNGRKRIWFFFYIMIVENYEKEIFPIIIPFISFVSEFILHRITHENFNTINTIQAKLNFPPSFFLSLLLYFFYLLMSYI